MARSISCPRDALVASIRSKLIDIEQHLFDEGFVDQSVGVATVDHVPGLAEGVDGVHRLIVVDAPLGDKDAHRLDEGVDRRLEGVGVGATQCTLDSELRSVRNDLVQLEVSEASVQSGAVVRVGGDGR